MLEIEIDGKKTTVPPGSTVMDAAHTLGVFIPHFCYHKKLSIAANCRMCLVEVEKAPKPLPACATPVANGMIVRTHSAAVIKAQQGVMEFLLINHPLDCPICDQGGECQLQDISVGYGQGESRYREAKRIVANKELGPLISTEMTRCIHCSRCVRFSEEIAGFQELGMAHRGEHTEVMPFLGQTVDSEISGNIIDLCPVGALTSKPFRYSARTWELSRRKSVAPHDGLGSNLIVQVKNQKVMRVLPLENEAINECWLSDRDRFSYEALNSSARASKPLIRRDGKLVETDWQSALELVASKLKETVNTHGRESVAAAASAQSTVEELFMLRKLMAGLGIEQVETRLRQRDFRLKTQGATWLGQSIDELGKSEAILIVGTSLRKEQPLLAQRLRQSVKRGLRLFSLNPHRDDLLAPLAGEYPVRPDQLLEALLTLILAACEQKQAARPDHIDFTGIDINEPARQIVAGLQGNTAILLGNLATHHPRQAEIFAAAAALSELCGAKLGVMSEAANSVGAQLVGAEVGGNVFAEAKKAYFLFNCEVQFDSHHAAEATRAVQAADFVVALTPFADAVNDYADVILPIAPFSETSGTYVSMEGRAQSFNGVVRPLGETRPGWKVLRVLGNVLGLSGFDYESSEQIRDEALAGDIASRLSNQLAVPVAVKAEPAQGLVRLGDVGLYQLDALTRHAPSLQQTRSAASPCLSANALTLEKLQLKVGDEAHVEQDSGHARLRVELEAGLPDQVIRVGTAHPLTCELGGLFAPITVQRA